MLNVKRVWGLAFTYVGAVIGAGFASGQELLHFFVRFGYPGLWGALVAGVGFMVLGILVFRLAVQKGITSYHELLPYLLGEGLGKLADFGLSFYLYAGLVIMLAGCGAVFWEYFYLPPWMGVGISSLALAGALWLQEEGVLALNTILVPTIILGALLVAGLAWDEARVIPMGHTDHMGISWLGSAVLYVSYNLIGGLVILVRFTDSHVQEGILGILLGGLVLGVLAGVLSLVLLENYKMTHELEVPMLYLARREGALLGLGYAVILWFAMLTSAVVDGAALALRFARSYLPYPVLVVLLLVTASGLTSFGFSLLVKTLYPLFGYLGLLVLAGVIYRYSHEKH